MDMRKEQMREKEPLTAMTAEGTEFRRPMGFIR